MPAKGQFKAGAKKRSVQQRKFNSRPEQKKRRAARNTTRRQAEASGKVHKGDGKDIDHKDRNPSNRSPKNLRVKSKSANRAHGGRVGNKKGKARGGRK